MFRRTCLRTLDRPILFFGLELEDLLATAVVAGALMFFVDPIAGTIAGPALWWILRKVKSGKAPGYLAALLYRAGFLSLPPIRRWVGAPHLVPAPAPGRRRVVRLSAAAGPADEQTEIFRAYFHEKPRIS